MATRVLEKLLSGSAQQTAWEVFHEASKLSPLDAPPRSEAVRERMVRMQPSLSYEGYPAIVLPLPGALDMRLSEAIRGRQTSRDIDAKPMNLDQLSTLLFHAYGVNRDETELGYPRRFRVVPSGGALYPLEIYVHASRITSLAAGIYHYNPEIHGLSLIDAGDKTRPISAALVQHDLALRASCFIFITAISERTVFKYGERGYRFALLEAGHVAQNFVLAAQSLDLAAVTIGGYLDRKVDELLRVDGLDQSAIYLLAAGGRGGERWLGL